MGAYPDLFPRRLRVARSKRRRIRQWSATLVLESTLLVAATLVLRAERVDSLGEVRDSTKSTVAQIDLVTNAIAQSRARMKEVERQMAVAHEVSRQPDWSIVMALLAREAEGSIVLENCQLLPASRAEGSETSEFRFTLQGSCGDQAELTGFVQRLQNTGIFSRLVVSETTRIEREKGKESLRFSIDSAFREGETP